MFTVSMIVLFSYVREAQYNAQRWRANARGGTHTRMSGAYTGNMHGAT
jgi:hypothetical protein